jgi:hypothetical protein
MRSHPWEHAKRGQTALSTAKDFLEIKDVAWGQSGLSPFCKLPRVTPTEICDIVPAKESAMLHWLANLWRRIDRWVHGEQVAQTYRRSNLHGRHR